MKKPVLSGKGFTRVILSIEKNILEEQKACIGGVWMKGCKCFACSGVNYQRSRLVEMMALFHGKPTVPYA